MMAKWLYGAATAVGMVPVLGLAAVSLAGFTATGITAGSPAAMLMSTYGGAVPAGSLCAVLQSIGAAGVTTETLVLVEGMAATLGLAGFVAGRKRKPSPSEECELSPSDECELSPDECELSPSDEYELSPSDESTLVCAQE
ncbi:hypothetical protein KP509_37G048000 [Ceratopteris richardii]|uniref:Uncharacterized protein n=1 Tax=Ceratopteris richardii TaxID=49495 RepID=A0A8T2Q9S4_CERRI|nr:hypothetical protein KP509_37G048000 [Ceratopteris richardii]